MRDSYRDQRGFTLIEILIAMAIVGVVGTAISNILLTGMKAWDFNQDRVEVQQSGRGVVSVLAKDIRGAVDVDNENVDYADFQNELRLKLQNGDYKRWVIYDNKLGYEKLDDWSSDNWPSEEDYGKKNPITTEIISNDAVFKYDVDRKIVTIDLTLEREGKTYDLINKVHLRN